MANKEKRIASDIDQYYEQAKRILAENRKFLDALANALILKKTLRAKDIKAIKNSLQID